MHWHRAAAHDDLPDTPQHANLTKYMHGRKALDQALDAFCDPVESKFMDTRSSQATEHLLVDAWNAVIAVAGATSHDSEKQQRLVDFVLALSQRPALTKGDETCQLQGGRVWRDLPILSMQMRESWNLAPTTHSDARHQEAWINLNAFAARLTASILSRKMKTLDYSLYCVWTVRDALEQQEATAEVATQAAAVWFLYAAPALWQLSKEERPFDGKVARSGPGFPDRDWKGFEKDRYTSWEHSFKHIRASLSDDKSIKLVDDALAAMRSVD